MNKISKAITVLLLATSMTTVNADCRDDIPSTTPSKDFTVHDNGTVTHNITGLMWMRCSLGQSWNGSTCTGNAISTYTWGNALAAAQSYSFAGYIDWRLPSKNELASLVELRCSNPAINSIIFPNTPHIPNGLFWSSSSSPFSSNGVFYVDFTYGTAVGHGWNRGSNGRVRLVRAGQ